MRKALYILDATAQAESHSICSEWVTIVILSPYLSWLRRTSQIVFPSPPKLSKAGGDYEIEVQETMQLPLIPFIEGFLNDMYRYCTSDSDVLRKAFIRFWGPQVRCGLSLPEPVSTAVVFCRFLAIIFGVSVPA